MIEKTWEEYKKRRAKKLEDGASVNPLDLLNKYNYATDEVAEQRYSICNSCPELVSLTKQCKKCGCFMALKVKLNQATCPLNKW